MGGQLGVVGVLNADLIDGVIENSSGMQHVHPVACSASVLFSICIAWWSHVSMSTTVVGSTAVVECRWCLATALVVQSIAEH